MIVAEMRNSFRNDKKSKQEKLKYFFENIRIYIGAQTAFSARLLEDENKFGKALYLCDKIVTFDIVFLPILRPIQLSSLPKTLQARFINLK